MADSWLGPLNLVFQSSDDEPWPGIIDQKIFYILNTYLQPNARLSPANAAQGLLELRVTMTERNYGMWFIFFTLFGLIFHCQWHCNSFQSRKNLGWPRSSSHPQIQLCSILSTSRAEWCRWPFSVLHWRFSVGPRGIRAWLSFQGIFQTRPSAGSIHPLSSSMAPPLWRCYLWSLS